MPAQYWRNLGMITSFSTYWYTVLAQYRRSLAPSTATVLHLLMLLYIFVINIFVFKFFFEHFFVSIFFPTFFFTETSAMKYIYYNFPIFWKFNTNFRCRNFFNKISSHLRVKWKIIYHGCPQRERALRIKFKKCFNKLKTILKLRHWVTS